MYINFRSQNFYIDFELYGHMYCYYNVLPEAIFVVNIKTISGGPTCNEYLSLCKISSTLSLLLIECTNFSEFSVKTKNH